MTTNLCRCSSLDSLCPSCRAEIEAHFAARAAECVDAQVAADEAVTYEPDADADDAARFLFGDPEGECLARGIRV